MKAQADFLSGFPQSRIHRVRYGVFAVFRAYDVILDVLNAVVVIHTSLPCWTRCGANKRAKMGIQNALWLWYNWNNPTTSETPFLRFFCSGVSICPNKCFIHRIAVIFC